MVATGSVGGAPDGIVLAVVPAAAMMAVAAVAAVAAVVAAGAVAAAGAVVVELVGSLGAEPGLAGVL